MRFLEVVCDLLGRFGQVFRKGDSKMIRLNRLVSPEGGKSQSIAWPDGGFRGRYRTCRK